MAEKFEVADADLAIVYAQNLGAENGYQAFAESLKERIVGKVTRKGIPIPETTATNSLMRRARVATFLTALHASGMPADKLPSPAKVKEHHLNSAALVALKGQPVGKRGKKSKRSAIPTATANAIAKVTGKLDISALKFE